MPTYTPQLIVYPWGIYAAIMGTKYSTGSYYGVLDAFDLEVMLVDDGYVFSPTHKWVQQPVPGGSPYDHEISGTNYARKTLTHPCTLGWDDTGSFAYCDHGTNPQWLNLGNDCGAIGGAVLYIKVLKRTNYGGGPWWWWTVDDGVSILLGWVPFSPAWTPDVAGTDDLDINWDSAANGGIFRFVAREFN